MSGKPDAILAGLEQIENPELRAALESFGRKIKEGAKTQPREEERAAGQESPKGQLVLFPEWADTRRAAASAVFRSALFPALARGQRKYFEREKIFSTRGVEIFFTGKQFDQSDLDVYLEILHILKDQPSGTDCTFTAYGLLKAIGRPTGFSQHQWLHSVLIRLCGGVVDMTDHKVRYFGSLLDGGVKDEITKHYTVSVNPKFAALFKRSWSSLEHEQRKQLRGHPTAQALHAYYSSHVVPGAHDFETLAGLAGLTDKNTRKIRLKIKAAHEMMKEKGFLKSYEVTGESIRTHINHTPSQNRHIAGKITKERKKQGEKVTA
jgi:TrfA protein